MTACQVHVFFSKIDLNGSKAMGMYFDSDLTPYTLIQVLKGGKTTDWTLTSTCTSLSLTVVETGMG